MSWSMRRRRGGIDLRLVIALDEASLEPLLRTGARSIGPSAHFLAEVIDLEWHRHLAMGRMSEAEQCAQRALLLDALAYEAIVIGDETQQRVEELEAGIT